MIRINQLKLPIGHSEEDLRQKIQKTLQIRRFLKAPFSDQYTYKIVRRSIDARKKPDLFYVYSVDVLFSGFHTQEEKAVELKMLQMLKNNNIMLTDVKKYTLPSKASCTDRPIIIGSGPAGLFCAYLLACAGCRPIVLERGESVENRKRTVESFWSGTATLNPESNVQFGEGGAGTFSDGKLNTLVKDPAGRNQFVLETFVRFGAKNSIVYEQKPHLGTDELTGIVKNMRESIISLGGEFYFERKATGLLIQNNAVTGVETEQGAMMSGHVVLAIGHSARDTFYMLKNSHVEMEAKSFAVGLRIEHPQAQINECQYGLQKTQTLPAADYKLTNQASNGRSVYSFCMCPGGYVVNASSERNRLAVNGMSYSDRDGANANSAMIVSVTPDDYGSDDALAGIEFQRRLEEKAYEIGKGNVPVQYYGDFKTGTISDLTKGTFAPSIKGAFHSANLRELLPEQMNEALVESIEKFGYTMLGYNRPDAILSGVESRTSSPVRIKRDNSGQSNIKGLYPCGEGAGYAGGITSAAMDGMKTAEYLLEEYSIGRDQKSTEE
ncbi:MAG: FAD-dependent oxidoreductase [bacterium]|nr:FAD-dependent oxidoreductase [bacterium]